MKSAVIFSILCSLTIAVSSDTDQDNKACYNKCNNDHGKCVNDCHISGNNSFSCLWKCRNIYYACTRKCYINLNKTPY